MRNDLECPYCGAGNEVCHDDGFGFEEDQFHEIECANCERVFYFTTSVSYHYFAHKHDGVRP